MRRSRFCLSRLVAFTLLAVLAPAPLLAGPPGLALLEAGESAVLRFRIENPRDTYWKLNPQRSHAVDRVEVREIGVVDGQMRVRVTARQAGMVVLAFDLARKDELGTVLAQAEYGLKIDPEGPAEARASVGDRLDLSLKGIPGTGYTWRLNEGESAGLDNVEIDEKGWSPLRLPGLAEDLVGAPALFGYRLRAVRVGKSRLVFEYVRPWEDKPATRQKVIELDIAE